MRKSAAALLLVFTPLLAGSMDDARTLIGERKYEQARSLLEQTINDPALRAESLLLLTRVCNGLEDYEDGVRYGKEAIKLLPQSSDAHHQYAEALRIKMSNVSRMKAMFTVGTYKKELQTALDLDPNNLGAREEQIGFLLNAPGIAGGSLSHARERAAELKQLDWRRGTIWQARIDFKDNNDEAGVAALRELLAKHPDDTDARFALAYWYQQQERFEEADREFEALTKHEEPRLAMNALYQRARTRVLGEYDLQEAIRMLNEFIEARPGELQGVPGAHAAYWRMGSAYEQLGQDDRARAAYEKSLAVEDNDKARKALKALNK